MRTRVPPQIWKEDIYLTNIFDEKRLRFVWKTSFYEDVLKIKNAIKLNS